MTQRGALLAKGRVLGIQFLELFKNGLYFKLAKRANILAGKLKRGIKALGYSFLTDSSTNQIFPVFSDTVIKKLQKKYGFYIWSRVDSKRSSIRLVTSWATPEEAVSRAFANFKPVEHRIEDCAVINGVRCINDSKATNVDSTLVALKALATGKKNIWLILGGLGKGAPYAPLAPYITQSVKNILTIGADAPKIEAELKGMAPIISCSTIDTAFDKCLGNALPGDILLFSPACASFDQFQNFEQRGEYFKTLAKRKSSQKT